MAIGVTLIHTRPNWGNKKLKLIKIELGRIGCSNFGFIKSREITLAHPPSTPQKNKVCTRLYNF